MEQADYDSKYKHLNLPLLKSYAEHWGERFPCIKRIALYLAAPDNYGTDLQYVLAANAPENRGVDSEVANYHDWADGINVRENELSKVYKGDSPPNHNFQWQWFSLDIEESIENYPNLNLDANFVLLDTEYVLYEKDMETQAAQLDVQEQPEKQDNKTKCQEIAADVWNIYPDLWIKNMIKHPEIQKLKKSNGDGYKDRTIHGWLSEIAPSNLSKHSRPTKTETKEQSEICKKLWIDPEI